MKGHRVPLGGDGVRLPIHFAPKARYANDFQGYLYRFDESHRRILCIVHLQRALHQPLAPLPPRPRFSKPC